MLIRWLTSIEISWLLIFELRLKHVLRIVIFYIIILMEEDRLHRIWFRQVFGNKMLQRLCFMKKVEKKSGFKSKLLEIETTNYCNIETILNCYKCLKCIRINHILWRKKKWASDGKPTAVYFNWSHMIGRQQTFLFSHSWLL